MLAQHELVVIDPAMAHPELDCFNLIARLSELPATYHLPAMWGMTSLTKGSSACKIGAVIILGSRASVYEALAWQDELGDWLKTRIEAATPMLGLCYGHQLLAHLLGGQIAYHSSGEKLVGARHVHLLPDARLGLLAPSEGSLVVSHREVVVSKPAGMRVFGQSSAVRYEAFSHETLPLWSFQAHPEATWQFCRNQALPLPANDSGSDPFAFGWGLMRRFLSFAAATASSDSRLASSCPPG